MGTKRLADRRALLATLALLAALSAPLVPAAGLPDSKVGTFTPALYDEAGKNGWTVISMKNDWKRIFAFDN